HALRGKECVIISLKTAGIKPPTAIIVNILEMKSNSSLSFLANKFHPACITAEKNTRSITDKFILFLFPSYNKLKIGSIKIFYNFNLYFFLFSGYNFNDDKR
ncbi:MAG: hypothetical protein DRO93_15145, partial [Candidatus Thorarchaeota archaeon]